jgi:GLPGLI family protein
MKRIQILIFTFFFIFRISVDAKEPKPDDISKIKCSYQFKYLTDSIKMTYNDKNLYIVLVGENLTKGYCYKTFYVDSMKSTPSGNQALAEMISDRLRNAPANAPLSYIEETVNLRSRGDFPAYLYKDYKRKKITVTDNVSTHYFKYEEDLIPLDWTISEDMMTVLDYPCQKATCSFRGRDWEAWFAPDIPVSEGPWKFHGLPGLIMKVQDTQSHYSFEMNGIQQLNEPIYIKIEKIHQKTDRISFLRLLMNEGVNLQAMDLAKINIQSDAEKKKYDYIEMDYK